MVDNADERELDERNEESFSKTNPSLSDCSMALSVRSWQGATGTEGALRVVTYNILAKGFVTSFIEGYVEPPE